MNRLNEKMLVCLLWATPMWLAPASVEAGELPTARRYISGEQDSCEFQFQAHMRVDMGLDYTAFDQTMGSGFRPLAKACKKEAIQLIQNYIILNQATEDSLRWHLAQLLGEVGRTVEAVHYAKSTLRENESGDFKWNAYVNGYIGYWQRDTAVLAQSIQVLNAHREHPGNQMNVKLLKSFARELRESKAQ